MNRMCDLLLKEASITLIYMLVMKGQVTLKMSPEIVLTINEVS